MKWRNTTLQEENVKLRKRLEKLENEYESSSRPVQGNASAAASEVAELRKRVQELEQMTALEPPPPPALVESQRQSSKPPFGEVNGSRFARKKSSPAIPQQVHAASPRRQTQASPLRFLKRKQMKESVTHEAPQVTADDTSSTASKLTF